MYRMLPGCAVEQGAQRLHGGLRRGQFGLEVIDVSGNQCVALAWATGDQDRTDIGDRHAQIA